MTGACGKCGTALSTLEHDTIYVDRAKCPDVLPSERFVQGDITDEGFLEEVVTGVDAIVHLAVTCLDFSDPDDEMLSTWRY
jgi:nucleoside-diphosphate-sugar epimerase